MFSAIIAISKLAGANAAKAGAMLLMMSGALLIITGVIFILTQIDPDALPRATLVVSILETLFGGLIYVSQYAEKVKKGTIISMTVAIGVLVAAVVGLSFIDTDKLMTSTVAMTAVMLGFAAMMAAMKNVKADKNSLSGIYALSGIVVILSGIIVGMCQIPNVDKAITVSGAISILLVSFASALFDSQWESAWQYYL